MVKHKTSFKNLEYHHHTKTMAMNSKLHTECTNKNTSNQNCKSEVKWQEEKGKRKAEKLYEDYETQRSICVAPLPKTMTKERLACFMAEFGNILKSHMGRNFFLVEYEKKDPVNILFSKSNWLRNEILCLRTVDRKNLSYFEDKDDNIKEDKASQPKKKAKKNKFTPIVVEDPLSYNTNIRPLIREIIEFEDEMTTLLEAIQLTEFERTTRYDVVCGHLEEIFKLTFPQCRLYKFGSTMAGLAFKNSDLDMYMYISDVDIRSTHYKTDNSFQEHAQVVLKKLKKIMYSRTTIFSNIIAIPKAKTPVIKFCYVPTNVSCDISFKNCFGIYKTNFLKFCASYDVRVKQLMMVIKYWAKEFKLTGVGRMPNYGLMCLIIFYLQTVGVLPILIQMREDCTPLFVGDWQINFNENYRQTASISDASTSDKSVVDLLHGFFDFIKQRFILTSNKSHNGVLSLLDGKTYDKDAFDKVTSLPDYMGSYKYHVLEDNGRKLETRNPIGVQDPIELNQNAIMSASENMLREFHRHCRTAADCIENDKKVNCINLLKHLLEKSVSPQSNASHRIHIGRFLNVGLPANFDSRTDIINKWEYKKNNWWFTIVNLIKDTLEMVCKFTVSVHFRNGTRIDQVDILPDTLIRDQEEIYFDCIANKCVWHNNNRAKHNRIFLDVQLSFLEKEAVVSDKVLKELNQQSGQNNINFRCQYKVNRTLRSEAVDIKLFQDETQKHFYNLSSSLYNWIPQIIDKTMAHMLQYNKSYDQLYHYRKRKNEQTENKRCS